MEVYFLNNASKIEVNEHAEVTMIPVPSRRPNPSSISDSKGGVYIWMIFFFPPQPQHVCGMIPGTIQPCGIIFLIRCIGLYVMMQAAQPRLFLHMIFVCAYCVVSSCATLLCAISYMRACSVLFAFSVYLCCLGFFFSVVCFSPKGFTQTRPFLSAFIQTHGGNEHLRPHLTSLQIAPLLFISAQISVDFLR